MRMLPQFWKALDEIPASTSDTRDWSARLGEEFDSVRRYLRRTGELATSIDCPSPGGDGCPRVVVRLPSGAIRAACGSSPSACDAIDLSRDDLVVLGLDHTVLAGDLARGLAVTQTDLPPGRRRVLYLGQHAVAAGLSSAVILALPGPRDPMVEEELWSSGLSTDRTIVLVPRIESLPQGLRARLIEAGHLLLDLSAITYIEADDRLGFLQPPTVLLAPVRDALLARLRATSGAPRIVLPPGTAWEQITLTLTSNATLVCSAPEWSRQLDPGEFGMRSGKNGKPTLAWTVLTGLAIEGGAISVTRPADRPKFQKQKEALSKKLRDAFGIDSDPLPWDRGQQRYVARFIVRDDRPVTERQATRRR